MNQILSNSKQKNNIILISVLGFLFGILSFYLSIPIAVASIIVLFLAILILWKVEIGVFVVVAAIPFTPTIPLVGLVLFTGISYLLSLITGNKKYTFKILPIDVFILAFVAVLLYSFVTSYAVSNSLQAFVIHIVLISFYFMLVNIIRTKKQLNWIIITFVIVTAVISLYGLYQYKVGGVTSDAWVDTTMFEDIKSRVVSTFGNPNVLGEYLVLILPLSVALIWTQKGWFNKSLSLIMVLLMLGCLLCTSSRGAWLGLILAMAVFAVLKDRRLIVLGIFVLILLPFFLPPWVINRFASIGNMQDSSSAYRVSVWIGSLKIVKDYWLSGIGLGLEPFRLVYPNYALSAAYALHSHNIYIQLLIETGIAGFTCFMGMLVVFFKNTVAYSIKCKDKFLSTVLVAVTAGLMGYLIQGLVDNIWYNYRVLLAFWVLIGIGMAAYRIAKTEKEEIDL